MTKIIEALDRLSEWTGHILSKASLGIMAITVLVVVIRYGFQSGHITLGGLRISSIALQESVMYLHAMLFMLASAYTLKHDAHVRVDVFYRRFSPRAKALVDLSGTLLLLFPACGFILYISLDFVDFAWNMKERSGESEGLAYVYLLKTLIPVMAVLLLLQGIAEALRSLIVLKGVAPDDREVSRI
ncbi:TRAP transporter small permease subunit [Ketobacter sp. MCCC 1A13808]|uniref:TRAP transporter small permease subunit n=1 Tax=Ketobacter sp. MCCC 1A13808 TaxID=2602738 RepID=UPI0012EB94F7|nr:TRAP transporter small permease subunit [Ketobacter sp. MCCC 1A13808]MVF13713.1 TRAP transporter small permease subunit [Ketobacter sp. MCCC 1A13808]